MKNLKPCNFILFLPRLAWIQIFFEAFLCLVSQKKKKKKKLNLKSLIIYDVYKTFIPFPFTNKNEKKKKEKKENEL